MLNFPAFLSGHEVRQRRPSMNSIAGTRQSTGFQYDPNAGYLVTALRFKYTVVPKIVTRPVFWAFLILHAATKVLFFAGIYSDDDQGILHVRWNDLKVLAAIATFFQVFYANQCYARYMHLYTSTRQVMSVGYDLSLAMKLNVGHFTQPHLRLAIRYMISQVVLFFCELDGRLDNEEWEDLMSIGMLTRDEQAYIRGMRPQEKRLVLIQWSADVACHAYLIGVGKAKVAANLWRGTLGLILHIRNLEQDIVDTVSLPIPFAYFQILCMMLVVNLFFLSLGMGATNSILTSVVYVFASIINIGMMEVATDMSDPFGDDDLDFPVGNWIVDWIHHMVLITEHDYEGMSNAWEDKLQQAGEAPLQQVDLDADIFRSSGFASAAPLSAGSASDESDGSGWMS